MSKKLEDTLSKLETALIRLGEALSADSSNALFVDGTIQRFEFVFELTWKTLKRALEVEGFKCETPRETLKIAFKAGWISNETLWMQMLEDRNLTSYTYDQPTAMEIYENIKNYYQEIDRVATFIREKNPQKSNT